LGQEVASLKVAKISIVDLLLTSAKYFFITMEKDANIEMYGSRNP
jgi:hypothetical protein